VAGLPRAAALDWIRDHEALDRGWYAGPVGWVDASGGGEFWLALRSALVRNAEPGSSAQSRARLFAGAGLVQGSRPDAELRETRLKLRALLAPLTEI
jgi:isochorismate synthase EntC